jgi:uncharacterized protein
MPSHELREIRERLLDAIQCWDRVAVAFSGGVDSAVVAKAVHLVRGERALAVTAVSPSLASGELEQAQALAQHIGIPHRVIHTREFENPDYLRNQPDRCYHCKTELYEHLIQLREQLDVDVVVSGANADDGGDHRPGLRAAAEHGIRHPLMECGITKDQVRLLAQDWNLPVWDKPASPCLSSRIAYGEEVTPERVRMIDQAEAWLRQHGFREMRVRYHRGNLARIELNLADLPRLLDPTFRDALILALRQYGFQFITFDLEGFRSGSLNTLVPVSQLERASPSHRPESTRSSHGNP